MSVFSASAMNALACPARSWAGSSAADNGALEAIKNMVNTSVASHDGRVTCKCNTADDSGQGKVVSWGVIIPRATAAGQAIPPRRAGRADGGPGAWGPAVNEAFSPASWDGPPHKGRPDRRTPP